MEMRVTETIMAIAAPLILMSVLRQRHLIRRAVQQIKELVLVGVIAAEFGALPRAPLAFRHLYGDRMIQASLFAVSQH